MKNANPKKQSAKREDAVKRLHPRLRDKIAAQEAGKSLRIVVQGTCKVCKRRSADVPATKQQVARFALDGDTTTGFRKYETRMLTTGVHRECQPVEDRMVKGEKKAVALANVAAKPAKGKAAADAVAEAKVNKAALDRRNKAAAARRKAANPAA